MFTQLSGKSLFFQGGFNSFTVTKFSLFKFQLGVPAFTVPQPDEAMRVLEEKASELDVTPNFNY